MSKSTSAAQPAENRMGTQPVGRLLFSMSTPIMLSMLVQSLYNIVDSIFVARYDEYAMTAVSLAFPIQNIMIGVGVGTSVGVAALLSRSLGAREFKDASRIAGNGILLAILCGAVFMIVGFVLPRPFFEAQVFSEASLMSEETARLVIEYGVKYLSICCIFSIGIFGEMMFERLLQSTGRSMLSMISQLTGAVINIIFDPLLIFGFGPFPELGVSGAAMATVMGQCAAMLLAMALNVKRNRDIRFGLSYLLPHLRTIGRIYAIGAPSIVMQVVGSVMTYGINLILMTLHDAAVFLFGVYFKLQSFIFMPVFGLTSGMVPIVSYNLGAKRRRRIIKTMKLSVISAFCIMALGFLLMQILPVPMLRLFGTSDETLELGKTALRVISISFLGAGPCIICGAAFQAMGRGGFSLIISVLRQLGALLPIAWLLSRTGRLNAVWWSFPLAELVSLGASALFLLHVYRTVIRPLPRGEIE